MTISHFIREHFRHFNAATLVNASDAYKAHLDAGGMMVVSLAGAMSTAELGLSLAAMIREGKVHAISCTGANLEEDLFGLVGRRSYVAVPHWRNLSLAEEADLYARQLNRVTDTCIPDTAICVVERELVSEWQAAERSTPALRQFPHEFLYRVLRSGTLAGHYQIDPGDSWIVAAAEADLPLVVPGWEDSTLGNLFAAKLLTGELRNPHVVKSGIEYLVEFARWYQSSARSLQSAVGSRDQGHKVVGSVGLFQVGGGIAGDFAICVVPMVRETLHREDLPLWGYFCQVSDSPPSYGGYSGAVPGEKITWGKLRADTPAFVIESDATIVVPLIFASVLGW